MQRALQAAREISKVCVCVCVWSNYSIRLRTHYRVRSSRLISSRRWGRVWSLLGRVRLAALSNLQPLTPSSYANLTQLTCSRGTCSWGSRNIGHQHLVSLLKVSVPANGKHRHMCSSVRVASCGKSATPRYEFSNCEFTLPLIGAKKLRPLLAPVDSAQHQKGTHSKL